MIIYHDLHDDGKGPVPDDGNQVLAGENQALDDNRLEPDTDKYGAEVRAEQ